ncbi:helix-turn-helix domain-containing protein [Listeria monocytogenes]|nr:helix-turn-helix domain-containing protein [Listeria monocytogenes]EEO6238771.1 helix-turn-helix domain-containing protein [Listeria monocytogenes]EIA7377801.1 helix-turn-helix domain-containing protein [Listeria monocytogenes]EIA8019536.1 helix-turn-helix domain-containing protein [Listeria monocytogenes]
MARAEYAKNVQRSLVALYYRGNTKYAICKEYGIPRTLLDIWIERYFGEELKTNEVLNFLQVRELKKQKEALQEEISALIEAINLFENNHGE